MISLFLKIDPTLTFFGRSISLIVLLAKAEDSKITASITSPRPSPIVYKLLILPFRTFCNIVEIVIALGSIVISIPIFFNSEI